MGKGSGACARPVMELGGMMISGVPAAVTPPEAGALDAMEYFKRYPYEYAAKKRSTQAFLHYNNLAFLSINGALRGHDTMNRS